MKPIIGITTTDTETRGHMALKTNYIKAVKLAGGVPVLIPLVDDGDYSSYLDLLDGIIFSGGVDISPLFYGKEPSLELDYLSIKRDRSELGLLNEAYVRKIPIMGICRGLQLINIGLEGTLYQDLKTEVEKVLGHSPKQGSKDLHHSIHIEKDTIMSQALLDEFIYVNSYHHQAIEYVGKNLKITSRAEDGVVESIEATDDRFLLGVQFHPEDLVEEYPKFLNLFRKLIEASVGKDKD